MKKQEEKRAVIYARVSTTKQEKKGLSIPGQIERCKAKLEKEGYEIVRVFAEAESASEEAEKRPVFQEMISFCIDKKNKINAVCVYDTSRFARRREDAVIYKRMLRKRGIKILYVEHNIDDKNEDDLFIEGIYELIDERYSKILAKITLRGMIDNAKQGFGNGGPPPLGYRWKRVKFGDTYKLKLEIDPKWAPVVRRIFELCLSGNGCINIAKTLNAEGIKKPSKKDWTSTDIHKILTNVKYKGAMSFKADNEIILVENTHEPIVSPEDFEKVQQILAHRRPYEERINPHRKVKFAGVLKCGLCKSSLVSATARGKGGTYYYYECRNARSGGNCEGLRVNAFELDEKITEALKHALTHEKALTSITNKLYAFAEEYNNEQRMKRISLEAQKDELLRRLERLYDLIERDMIELEDALPRIEQLKRSCREIESEIENIKEISLPLEKETVLSVAKETLKDIISKATSEELVSFLKTLGAIIYVYKNNHFEIYINPNFFFHKEFIGRIPMPCH
ncbi:MAG: recombinase family protein [Nitrososphaeria archaeon]